MIPPILEKSIRRLMELDQESVMALADIAEERLRQVESEGWTLAHDDAHRSGEMSAAAAAYALAPHTPSTSRSLRPSFWPWGQEWWKPKSLHRNRTRAGALLVAEIARHSRTASKINAPKSPPLPNPPPAPERDVIERAKDIATSNENTTYPSRASAQYVRSVVADLLALIEERT